jgi:hypothetical protein
MIHWLIEQTVWLHIYTWWKGVSKGHIPWGSDPFAKSPEPFMKCHVYLIRGVSLWRDAN